MTSLMKKFNKNLTGIICFSMILSLLLPARSVTYAQADTVYDFEDGTLMGWYQAWGDGYAQTEPVTMSQDLSVQGNQYSLKANTNFSGSDWQAAALAVNSGVDLGEYEEVSYDVFVPASFSGAFSLSTALNGAWQEINYSSHNIEEAAVTTINGHHYIVIHETALIPKGAIQRQLVIQLAKNSALTYSGPIYVDNIALTAREEPTEEPPAGTVTTYLAKNAVLNGVGVEFRSTPASGDSLYSGPGYISFFYDERLGTGTATFNVTADTSGLYNLSVGYYAPYGYKESGLVVNGQGGGSLVLPAPDEGSVVKETSGGKVLLNEGANTITITRGWGYYGIEYIKLESATPAPASNKLEAEDGLMTGTIAVGNSIAGYSGTGYASFQQEGSLTLTYNAAASGLYDVSIIYSSPFGDKKTEMVVNGQSMGEITFAQSSVFQEVSAGKVMLNTGENTIRFNPNWGWYNIDYVKLTAATPPNTHNVQAELVNPNASFEAKALMNYLVDRYGKNIISGQQELSDAEWVYQQTGKYPALFGSDLMDYSPSRVERGTTSAEVEKMIQWFRNGGIVALTWHWNAPKGLYDVPGKEWWRGFYTEATSFDVKYAMDHPESEDYQLILRDIDAIAMQLKRLQDAGVSVLWRPLHEAEGGWFWWGAKGPGPAKQLYLLLYDRLTNHHKLNNLIWVWNSEKPEWYPGDDVVDIVSIDNYSPQGDYNPVSTRYDNLVTLVNDKKVVALAENGSIPDPELLQVYRADWSWFMTWAGHFIRDGKQNSPEHLQAVYHSDYVITRDELPENLYVYTLPGAPVAEVNYSETAPTNQNVVATIYPNESVTITNNGGSKSHTFTENGSFTFEFFDADGNEGSVTAMVNNIDNIAPALSVEASKSILTVPNHKLENIELRWEANDIGSGVAGVTLVSVTSNEPDNGPDDGDTVNDIQGSDIGTADTLIQLRAERSGTGNGRVYTIIYEIVDFAGNKSTASTTVSVPRNAE